MPSFGFSSTPLSDGRVLIAGGRTRGGLDGGLLADTYYFEPATGAWTRGPDLSVPRAGHTATLLPDGGVLIVGGINRLQPDPTSRDVEILDPTNNSVRVVAALGQARENHQAVGLADGTTVIIGGNVQAIVDPVELFDLASQALTTLASLNLPTRLSAIVLGGSELLVIGVRDDNRSAAGILDVRAQTYEELEPPQIPRWRPRLTLLSDGRILVVGSLAGTEPFAEIYDPLSGEFHLVR